jgi:hypothetical protein
MTRARNGFNGGRGSDIGFSRESDRRAQFCFVTLFVRVSAAHIRRSLYRNRSKSASRISSKSFSGKRFIDKPDFALDTKESELRAMRAVMETEVRLGFVPRDSLVSSDRLDGESQRPKDATLVHAADPDQRLEPQCIAAADPVRGACPSGTGHHQLRPIASFTAVRPCPTDAQKSLVAQNPRRL